MKKSFAMKSLSILLVAVMAVFLCGFALPAETNDQAERDTNTAETTALTESEEETNSQTRFLIVGGAVLAACAGFYVFLSVKTRRGK